MSVTVQMPVYKVRLRYLRRIQSLTSLQEDLDTVIKPTIESLKQAITTFERQGGTVNVIVCDDGLQLLPEDQQLERIKYYKANNIGYVARPPDGQKGFERRGKFKKAGNLNFANKMSLMIETWMDHLRPHRYGPRGADGWTEDNEMELYKEAKDIVMEKSVWPGWVDGNVRM